MGGTISTKCGHSASACRSSQGSIKPICDLMTVAVDSLDVQLKDEEYMDESLGGGFIPVRAASELVLPMIAEILVWLKSQTITEAYQKA